MYTLQSELRLFIFIVLVSAIIGWMLGSVAWTLIGSMSCYIAWNLRQRTRLANWLQSNTPSDPPTSHGLWGAIFDDIYKIQQAQFKYRGRLKKTLKRFRDSTQALRDGFIMLDSQGNIEWWNPAAEQLLGLKSPNDVNQLITNLIRTPEFKTYIESTNYE